MNKRIRRSPWRSSLVLIFCMIFMTCLTGCGENTGDSGESTATGAAYITLLVGSPQLNSDGAATVAVTALVMNGSRNALKDQTVAFSTNSGSLVVASETTDANGNATATLGTGGDPTNRMITVTAATGNISATNTVTVTGTTSSISGLASLSLGDSTDLTIFLKNSAGTGIPGKTVAVSSANGNTLSAASYVTNNSGQITVTVRATAGGADTITAAAIGATKTFSLNVSSAILTITPPTSGQEVNINTWQPVTATYTNAGSPVVGATVNFSTTRGTLDAASAVTGAAGTATVNVSSTNSGAALVSAYVTPGPSAQVAIEFIATTAATVTVQASPGAIGTNSSGQTTEKSLITAVVRDVNDNLVKNKTVIFTIVTDASAGQLSPASAITDSSGAASSYFIAGAAPGGLNGVTIRATVGNLSGTVTLTVAKKALFITLATGPTILKVEPNKYQKDYVALVTDAAGSPVVGAVVVPTLTPLYYKRGYYAWPTTAGASGWSQVNTLVSGSSTLPGVPACVNEDSITHNPLYDFNGILDPGEDQNANNRLDPGNVASVTATVTDSAGLSTLSIVYARDYAYWVNVKLEAWATTAGSTASAFVSFDLQGEASDYGSPTSSPPGNPSPFGISTSCFIVSPPPTPTPTPPTPTGLAATLVTGPPLRVDLIWTASTGAVSYRIYRNGTLLQSPTAAPATDRTVADGTPYCYAISAVDALGIESARSALTCVTTP